MQSQESSPLNPPLQGVQILDLTRILAGPFATMQLADLGAEIIKVEPPGGDDTRQWGPPFIKGESAYFLSINRSKKSVVIDLKSEAGKREFAHLVKKSEVVIENFRPGTLEKLGFSYQDLQDLKENIIYCTISGFGHESSQRQVPSYDVIVQGLSGAQSLTGDPDGPPYRFGLSIADMAAGLNAVQSILAALYRKEKTGQGARIDISMLDTMAGLLTYHGQIYFATGQTPRRVGNEHPTIVPYGTFEASDGYLNVGVGNDRLFQKLCTSLDRPELARDQRFATNSDRVQNREILLLLLKEIFRERPLEEWLKLLAQEGIPCGPVWTVGEVLDSTYLAERDLIWEVEHPTAGSIPLVGSPLRFTGENWPTPAPPPRLDQDRREILADFNTSNDHPPSKKEQNK